VSGWAPGGIWAAQAYALMQWRAIAGIVETRTRRNVSSHDGLAGREP